jgi:hypothetical protein
MEFPPHRANDRRRARILSLETMGLDLSLRSHLCDKSMTLFPQARRVEGDWI